MKLNSFYILLFIISIIIASFSQILLKKGSQKKNIYINSFTIIGYIIMVISTLLTLIAYKFVDLSMAAVLQALSFVFVALFSAFILKETINKTTILGISMIIIGVITFSL